MFSSSSFSRPRVSNPRHVAMMLESIYHVTTYTCHSDQLRRRAWGGGFDPHVKKLFSRTHFVRNTRYRNRMAICHISCESTISTVVSEINWRNWGLGFACQTGASRAIPFIRSRSPPLVIEYMYLVLKYIQCISSSVMLLMPCRCCHAGPVVNVLPPTPPYHARRN